MKVIDAIIINQTTWLRSVHFMCPFCALEFVVSRDDYNAFMQQCDCGRELVVKIKRPKYRIQWCYNAFAHLPGQPLLTGYWITPYLSNGELDKPDMNTFKPLSL